MDQDELWQKVGNGIGAIVLLCTLAVGLAFTVFMVTWLV